MQRQKPAFAKRINDSFVRSDFVVVFYRGKSGDIETDIGYYCIPIDDRDNSCLTMGCWERRYCGEEIKNVVGWSPIPHMVFTA